MAFFTINNAYGDFFRDLLPWDHMDPERLLFS